VPTSGKKPLASLIRPKPTRKIIEQSSTVRKAQVRVTNTKLCPVCNSTLKVELSGAGARRRGKCGRCQKTYALR
jgi:transposase-like protein